jgi:hypothetical protein
MTTVVTTKSRLVVLERANYKLATGRSETIALEITGEGKRSFEKSRGKQLLHLSLGATVGGGRSVKKAIETL